MAKVKATQEQQRLQEAHHNNKAWLKWGPYLSERQWGTVREDYSEHGEAWDYFPHDHARSRVYRWGEDGLAGISDDREERRRLAQDLAQRTLREAYRQGLSLEELVAALKEAARKIERLSEEDS